MGSYPLRKLALATSNNPAYVNLGASVRALERPTAATLGQAADMPIWEQDHIATLLPRNRVECVLSRQEPYRALGANYFDERRRHYTVDRLARRIEHLGYRVHLEPMTTSVA
jgi:hypothetical protein